MLRHLTYFFLFNIMFLVNIEKEVEDMTEDRNELKSCIQQFFKMLKQYPDDHSSTYEFVSFIKDLLRIQTKETIPTIEVMTLIKHEKPVVFSNLKKMSAYNTMLEILTELSIDIETARENLRSIIK